VNLYSSGRHARLMTRSDKWETASQRPLTNPANPILAAARRSPGAVIWYADLPEYPTPEQIEHGCAVLARRAAVFS